MRLLIGLLLAFAVAASVGLGTTLLTLQEGTPFGGFTVGAWTAWPRTGTSDIDPYARALIARSGELPMGAGDGIAFVATIDDAGAALDGLVDRVVGHVGQARGDEGRPQPRVALRVTAALTGRHRDLARELGEKLRAPRIDGTLLVHDVLEL